MITVNNCAPVVAVGAFWVTGQYGRIQELWVVETADPSQAALAPSGSTDFSQ